MEGAGGRPAGIYVREIESVELGPENIAFGAKGGVGFLLVDARRGVFDDVGEGEVGIFGGLGETSGEIIEA